MGTPETNMSPDSTSSLFPDRPIRPLPKRRLRERLSPDVADSIKFPPVPHTNIPLFVYPYNTRDDSPPLGAGLGLTANRDATGRITEDAGFRRNGATSGREDESLMSQARKALGSRGFHESRSGAPRHAKPPAPPSTASSVDGYDSFENTNNKKKRKIPIAGELSLNGTHVLSESNGLAMGMPSPPATADPDSPDISHTSTPYYQSGGPLSSAQGISGPGRGRYGRIRNGRSPLRALSDSNGNWVGRNMKVRNGQQYPSPPAENSGIISTAIASAEKLPLPTGQENISLLQQQASTKSTPTTSSAQFTFTFGSQNPVSWPGSDPSPRMTNRSYQSSPSDYGGMAARVGQSQHGASSHLPGNGGAQADNYPADNHPRKSSPAGAAGRKKTRRRTNSLLQAAKQRRRDAEMQNLHHPPTPDTYYLCEFCEYELIFGHPPEALIRQYEIKDRQRRQGEAERRRLLEKAKMKSRKGKKASKGSAKNNEAAAVDRNSANAIDPNVPPPPPGPHEYDEGQDTRSDEHDSEDHHEDHLASDSNPERLTKEDYSQLQETRLGHEMHSPGSSQPTVSV
ncbi:hypothetical protein F5Y16DRAFT_382401 [Xylariaceae sp. FL0255]|nr:hypothetical protein F5Y16DRAFT_382401 [Xylariaceae sp. FL0255]